MAKSLEQYAGSIAPESGETAPRKKNYGALVLQKEQEDLRAAQERAGIILSVYAKNDRVSADLQTQIVKGIRAGEDPARLLLLSLQAFRAMTENAMWDEAGEELLRIRGEILLEPEPAQLLIESLEEDITILRAALEGELDTKQRARIHSAIDQRAERIARVKSLVGTA